MVYTTVNFIENRLPAQSSSLDAHIFFSLIIRGNSILLCRHYRALTLGDFTATQVDRFSSVTASSCYVVWVVILVEDFMTVSSGAPCHARAAERTMQSES
jgi:hypothetical protein